MYNSPFSCGLRAIYFLSSFWVRRFLFLHCFYFFFFCLALVLFPLLSFTFSFSLLCLHSCLLLILLLSLSLFWLLFFLFNSCSHHPFLFIIFFLFLVLYIFLAFTATLAVPFCPISKYFFVFKFIQKISGAVFLEWDDFERNIFFSGTKHSKMRMKQTHFKKFYSARSIYIVQ